MNSRKSIIVWVLFMMSCAPLVVIAADDGLNGGSNLKTCCSRDKYRTCLDLRDKLIDKEHLQAVLRDKEIHHDLNCNCELLDDVEGKVDFRHKNQDQQADILERLLLESTTSSIKPQNP